MNEVGNLEYKKRGISTNLLKVIAACAMLCDHIAVVFFESQYIMRSIGRLAFPIFAFLIVEGYIHTSDVKKYAIRLFAFSLVAQIPYVLAFSGKAYSPNVIFTLFLGLVSIYILDTSESTSKFMVPIALALIAELLSSDHGAFGVMMIIIFYMYKPMKKKIIAGAILIICMQALIIIGNKNIDKYSFIMLFYLAPLILIYLYNGRKGLTNKISKWFFYIFYPLHLILIWLINFLINQS